MNQSIKDFANVVFIQFSCNQANRPKYGAERRAEMKAALDRGERVEGYRAKWIIDTMYKVVDVLGKSAETFNNTHYNDMISTNDMVDVLNSAIHKLKQSPDE